MSIELHRGDLPDHVKFMGSVAIDTETMGLNPHRDRLCLVQLSGGDGNAHLVQIAQGQSRAPNLKAILEDHNLTKIFHYARFDVAVLNKYLAARVRPVYCTKIASRLVRTYSDRHGLKDLCRELIGVDLSKKQQSSDWGADELSQDQLDYAASDVLYLHKLVSRLNVMLERSGRLELATSCFEFLSTRADLDLLGWSEQDIFSHSISNH
ncbi:MAG: ribonuclease D [Alphaproteobacteria bacterium]|nr:ribonuclease D [Alphaproteobacteria bacterium]